MRRIIFAITILVFLVPYLSIDLYANEKSTVVMVGGTLIDGTGSKPIKDAVIVIEKDKIKAVGARSQVKIPENAKIIDVSGKWILPGFIDLHLHLTYALNMQMEFRDTDSLRTLRALSLMNRLLKGGITSIRDVTAENEPMNALKRAVKLGYTNTSRLFCTGEGITTTSGVGSSRTATAIANGADEWRKEVRLRRKLGFKYIKVFPPYTEEELKAAIDEAQTWGLRTIVHSISATDVEEGRPLMFRMAVENGAQCLEHSRVMTDDDVKLIAESGVHFVPTMAILRRIIKRSSPQVVENRKKYLTLKGIERTLKKAKELNVLIGIGTDFVFKLTEEYPQCYFEEMRYYEEMGFTLMETIVCATKNGGIILGKEDELGTLEPRKLADLQVISEDPLKSLDALGHPELVMVGGKIIIDNR